MTTRWIDKVGMTERLVVRREIGGNFWFDILRFRLQLAKPE